MDEIGRRRVEHHDLHRDSERTLEVALDVEEQRLQRGRRVRGEQHRDIDIARRARVTTGDAAEEIGGHHIGAAAENLLECRLDVPRASHAEIIRSPAIG